LSSTKIPKTDQQRTLAWLRTGVILAALLPLLLFCAIATIRYQQILDEKQRNTERFTRIVAEHALKIFDANQAVLERLLEITGNDNDAAIAAKEGMLHQKIKAMVKDLPQVQSVWVMNAQGRPLLADRFMPVPAELNIADRESFQFHREGNKGTYITGVLLGKKTREPFFDMTRRRQFADGSFAGTVQVSLHPKYLIDFYREISATEPGLVISLVRNDGALLARWPNPPTIGARLPENSELLGKMIQGASDGTLDSVSPIDGIKKIASFRKLDGYPLYAYAGYARPTIIQAWLREMGILALFAIPFTIVIGIAGGFAVRNTRRELAMVNMLREESLHRQRVEEALHQSQKMEALGHLTGGVAHDFNNLLMVVQMNAYLLQQTVTQLAVNPRMEAILRGVATGAKLTRQLLSFSRRQPLQPFMLDLQQVFASLVALCEPILGSSIKLNLTIDPLTPQIKIDPAELELAMINLAVNAKYAMPNGGRFDIKAQPLNMPGMREPWVEISVRDTGSGIAPELLGQVFEPFFTTKPLGEGTGLGLSQVYGMCQAAGGVASIESAVGNGTTVYLRLPGYQEAAKLVSNSVAQPVLSLQLNVLIVEDNDEIAEAALATIKFLGCTAERRSGAYAALDYLHRQHLAVDVVLSDIVMPGELDGIELAQFIQRKYPHLSVALMTGYTDKLSQAEELGIPILSKPFNIEALTNLLIPISHQKRIEAKDLVAHETSICESAAHVQAR
jgi:two-component system, NtrC family, sensor kinase